MKRLRNVLESGVIAISMFSLLPAPTLEWRRDNLRTMLCFFPLVGVVAGGMQLLWFRLAMEWMMAPGLFAAVAVLLSLTVSGGVHMDGLADTFDAVGSRQEQKKRLEILSDPNTGAFGVMGVTVYLLLGYGLWQQVYASPSLLFLAVTGPVMARCMGALAMTTIPPAKKEGLAAYFAGVAARPVVWISGTACLFVVLVYGIWSSPLWGSTAAVGTALFGFWYRHSCLRVFGGITGDLVGCLVQLGELLFLAVAATGGMLTP